MYDFWNFIKIQFTISLALIEWKSFIIFQGVLTPPKNKKIGTKAGKCLI